MAATKMSDLMQLLSLLLPSTVRHLLQFQPLKSFNPQQTLNPSTHSSTYANSLAAEACLKPSPQTPQLSVISFNLLLSVDTCCIIFVLC